MCMKNGRRIWIGWIGYGFHIPVASKVLPQDRVVRLHDLAMLHASVGDCDSVVIFEGQEWEIDRKKTHDEFEVLGQRESNDGQHSLEWVRGVVDAGRDQMTQG